MVSHPSDPRRYAKASAADLPRCCRHGGFTLLEVLVALTVIAVALAATIKTTGNATLNAAYLRDKTLADWVAMNQFMDLRARRAFPNAGSASGTAEMAGREWAWHMQVESFMSDQLRRVEITVRRPEDDDDTAQTTLTVLLDQPDR